MMNNIEIELDGVPSSPSELLWELAISRARRILEYKNALSDLYEACQSTGYPHEACKRAEELLERIGA